MGTSVASGRGHGRVAGRRVWFQVHKWVGLLLFIVLIPLSATGSLLVWHDWTDSLVNPRRYAVTAGAERRPIGDYVAAARAVLKPGDRIASIDMPHGVGKPVVVGASPEPTGGKAAQSGPPSRHQVWIDPGTARVLDHADSRTGLVRTLHVIHGSLMIPVWGRTIVGWLGVAMLMSCLTGIYLWWPSIGSMLAGFRWTRGPLVSGNLHHQVGIWIVLPLGILSFTGVWISFPSVFRPIEAMLAGAPGDGRPASPPDRRARPLGITALDPNEVANLVTRHAGTSPIVQIRWPMDRAPDWTVTVEGSEAAQYKVGDRTARVETAPTGARGRFMRDLHDGSSYNPVWQTIIFLGGLAPAILGLTGLIMWLRTRGWRRKAVDRRRRPRELGEGRI